MADSPKEGLDRNALLHAIVYVLTRYVLVQY